MSIHQSPSEFAGKKVIVTTKSPLHNQTDTDVLFVVEDWWDRIAGRSWMVAEGNPACLIYAMRSAVAGLPTDNEVVYGKTVNGLGHLVHADEILGVLDEPEAAS